MQLDRGILDLELLLTGNQRARLADWQGQQLLLYFYPKASTPGCTLEGRDFHAALADFAACNTRILGVSRDGIKAQENFKAKQGFGFDLVADTEEQLCKAFDVIKHKKLYGKEYLGIERSSFLLDTRGQVHRAWRKVKVAGHVEEVLKAACALHQGIN